MSATETIPGTDALRLVPVEPTKAMLAAGQAAGDYGDALRRAWSAMLSAAPTVPLSTPMGGEVEALREALERIRDLPDLFGAFPPDDQMREIARQALAASSPSPAQGEITDEQISKWVWEAQRKSADMIGQFRHVVERALSASPRPAAVAWRWRFTAGAYGIEGATPGAWTYMERPPQFEPHEAWRREVQALGVIAAPPSVQPVEGK